MLLSYYAEIKALKHNNYSSQSNMVQFCKKWEHEELRKNPKELGLRQIGDALWNEKYGTWIVPRSSWQHSCSGWNDSPLNIYFSVHIKLYTFYYYIIF